MGFTINIYYKGENGSAKAFANEMITSGIVDEIRSKEGNLRYEYFSPLDDQESLDRHHKSETMNKIIELRNNYDLHMKVEKYILDDNNNQDESYIRK